MQGIPCAIKHWPWMPFQKNDFCQCWRSIRCCLLVQSIDIDIRNNYATVYCFLVVATDSIPDVLGCRNISFCSWLANKELFYILETGEKMLSSELTSGWAGVNQSKVFKIEITMKHEWNLCWANNTCRCTWEVWGVWVVWWWWWLTQREAYQNSSYIFKTDKRCMI